MFVYSYYVKYVKEVLATIYDIYRATVGVSYLRSEFPRWQQKYLLTPTSIASISTKINAHNLLTMWYHTQTCHHARTLYVGLPESEEARDRWEMQGTLARLDGDQAECKRTAPSRIRNMDLRITCIAAIPRSTTELRKLVLLVDAENCRPHMLYYYVQIHGANSAQVAI